MNYLKYTYTGLSIYLICLSLSLVIPLTFTSESDSHSASILYLGPMCSNYCSWKGPHWQVGSRWSNSKFPSSFNVFGYQILLSMNRSLYTLQTTSADASSPLPIWRPHGLNRGRRDNKGRTHLTWLVLLWAGFGSRCWWWLGGCRAGFFSILDTLKR